MALGYSLIFLLVKKKMDMWRLSAKIQTDVMFSSVSLIPAFILSTFR